MIFAHHYGSDCIAVVLIALIVAVAVEAFVLPRWRRRRIWKAKRQQWANVHPYFGLRKF